MFAGAKRRWRVRREIKAARRVLKDDIALMLVACGTCRNCREQLEFRERAPRRYW